MDLYNYRNNVPADLKANYIKIDDTLFFGQPVEDSAYSFYLVLNQPGNIETLFSRSLRFVFKDLKSQIGRFKTFTIEPINRDASILKISLKSFNEQKAVDFLNYLTSEYLNRGLEKKNLIAINTIQFIDNQLMDITDSLSYSEVELQDFQTSHEVMDMDFQTKQVFEYMSDLESQKAELIVKSKYYSSLEKYVQNNASIEDGMVVPSAMGIDDPLTSSLIQELSGLYNDRAELLLTSTEKNPSVLDIISDSDRIPSIL